MSQLIHILKYKFIAFFKTSTRFSLVSFLKEFASLVVYGGFAIGAFYFSKSLIAYLLVTAKIGMFLLHEFIATGLFIFFLSINAGNIIVSFSTLYKSDEVYYLLTKPVNPAKIFLIKFLDNFFYSSSTMMMFLLALLAGYSVYFNISPYLILIIFLFDLIPFMVSAGSLGVIILLLLIKLASRIGVRPVFYILAGMYLSSIVLFFNIISPAQLVADVMKYYPNVNQYFGDLVPGVIKYLPNHWLSESLYWISSGKIEDSILYIFYQIILSLFLFSLALFAGYKWYHKTWLLVLDLRNRKKKIMRFQKSILNFSNGKYFKPAHDSIFKKDLFTFLREPAQVIHIAVLAFLIIVFVVSLKGIYLKGMYNSYIKTIIYLVIQLFNLLLITTLSLRFVFPLISLEGKSFWKIKSAPISNNNYMWIRLLPWIIIILFTAEILGILTVYKFSYELAVFSGVITFFISTAIIMMNFGMGALYANYKEKNPIRIASSQGASLTFLLCVLFMLFVVVVQLIPINQLFYMQYRNISQSNIQFYYMSFLIALVSVIISVLFFFIAKRSLNKDF